jgi:hypothetical protein
MSANRPVSDYAHLVAELRWWFWAHEWGGEYPSSEARLTAIAEYAADTELIRQETMERPAGSTGAPAGP